MTCARCSVVFAGERTGSDSAVVTMTRAGTTCDLPLHLDVRCHSPTGHEWGYAGSGPAQLALAMCVELVGPAPALRVYQAVKVRLVSTIQGDVWTLTGPAVMDAINAAEREARYA